MNVLLLLLLAQSPLFSADRIVEIHEQVARECPRQWQMSHAHEGDGWHAEARDYIIEVIKRVNKESGGSVGGNWRRGNVGDLSMDGVTFRAADGKFYFADTIRGAGGPSPSIGFNVTGEAPEVGFVDASELPAPARACGVAPPPAPKPNPDPTPNPNPAPAPAPPVDLGPVLAALREAQADRDLLRAQIAALAERLEAANQSVLVSIDLGKQQLANPPSYRGGIFGIPVVLRPEK
jgi:hypothetical protein